MHYEFTVKEPTFFKMKKPFVYPETSSVETNMLIVMVALYHGENVIVEVNNSWKLIFAYRA